MYLQWTVLIYANVLQVFQDILADELLPDLFVYFVRLVTWTKKHTLCGYPGSLSDQIVFSAEKMNYFFL